MSSRRPARRVTVRRVATVLVWMVLVSVAGCGGGGGGGTPAGQQGPAAAFLQAYVRPDGRVARPDQGEDTVSEGQAYAMLLAEAAGDGETFDRVWRWTRDHLRRADGLFAFHADRSGRILDQEPASDADLLVAWALLRHGGPDADSLHAEGKQVAVAILDHEVTTDPAGVPVLAAGPWATGRPASLDPSYWSPPAYRDLARLTGDPRWDRLAGAVLPLTRRFTDAGRLLPPDWVAMTADGALRPEPAPGGTPAQTQYGLDAQRLVVWLAVACDRQARALAGRWWTVLRQTDRSAALALHPDGQVLDPTPAPLPLVAAAAAAAAAGDTASRDRLLDRADLQHRQHPTYYGGAWAALGRLLLTSSTLTSCPHLLRRSR